MADVSAAVLPADIIAALDDAMDVNIAVAFVSQRGLESGIQSALSAALDRGADIKFLLDLSTGATDPSALWALLAISRRSPNHFRLRALIPEANSILHTKLCMFRTGDRCTLITGSANWTAGGLTDNVEHGVTVKGSASDPVFRQALDFFSGVWALERARAIDEEAARIYESYAGRVRATSQRAARLAAGALTRLNQHLRQAPPALVWPGPEIAYVLGLIAARGEFDDSTRNIRIRLRYGIRFYRHGEVRVSGQGYRVEEVIPAIPAHIRDRLAALLGVPVSVEPVPPRLAPSYTIRMSLAGRPDLFDLIRQPMQPFDNCDQFRLPSGLATAPDAVVTEFVRGFAVACGLLTDGTSLPANPRTGVPGIRVVWLRPKAANSQLFRQLQDLIETRLGFTVYRQQRSYREPHLKIRCEDFQQIGFGIPWWDALVEQGSQHNQAMFP